jgi:hypothetical protein
MVRQPVLVHASDAAAVVAGGGVGGAATCGPPQNLQGIKHQYTSTTYIHTLLLLFQENLDCFRRLQTTLQKNVFIMV